MAHFDSSDYPAAQPHDALRELAPDLFFVGGTMRMKPLMVISRNMIVVRNGHELTLVNPVRLSPAGEADLEALGTVRHVVRLGVFHGYDDRYTVARFGASFWSQQHSDNIQSPAPDEVLKDGGPTPIPGAVVFEFRETKKAECTMLLKHGDGVLLACDSLQHYGDFSRHSLAAKLIMPLLGFRREMLVGPLWLKMLTRRGGSIRPDFERLMELEFDAFVGAHGTPLMSGAKAAVRAAIARAQFEVS